jgi:hypothetical protein
MKTEIWDAHCHLSGVPGDTPEARLGKLLEYADRMGIARLCVFMGLKWNYDPSPETMRQENDDVLRAIRAFPDRVLEDGAVPIPMLDTKIRRWIADQPGGTP